MCHYELVGCIKRRLEEEGIGGSGLEQAEQFHGERAWEGGGMNADQPAGGLFKPVQVGEAGAQQALAFAGLTELVRRTCAAGRG